MSIDIKHEVTPRKHGRLSDKDFPVQNRIEEIEKLRSYYADGGRMALLLGERSSGKSSLANYLAHNPPIADVKMTYIDMQASFNLDDLMDEFAYHFHEDEAITVDPTEEGIIGHLQKSGKRIILIDEIERPFKLEDREIFGIRFTEFVRKLSEVENLSFLFCGCSDMPPEIRQEIDQITAYISPPEKQAVMTLEPIPMEQRPLVY